MLDSEIRLSADLIQPLQIWRARVGEILIVSDPEETFYKARITGLDANGASLVPFAVCHPSESALQIEVYQAIPDKERFELVLQKLTEIGVARIVPYTSQRSSTLEERDAKQKKSHRWPEVTWRAARQSRRAQLPELWAPLEWEECLQVAADAELSLLLYEGEGRWPLREALKDFRGQTLSLMIGPEGGFSDAEVEQARNLGILPVGMGPRILRTETAAIIGAAAVQYELGDLGTA